MTDLPPMDQSELDASPTASEPETVSFLSSWIDTGTYDADAKTLELTFVKGGSTVYQDVPPEIWQGLNGAVSPGKFFRDYIQRKFSWF